MNATQKTQDLRGEVIQCPAGWYPAVFRKNEKRPVIEGATVYATREEAEAGAERLLEDTVKIINNDLTTTDHAASARIVHEAFETQRLLAAMFGVQVEGRIDESDPSSLVFVIHGQGQPFARIRCRWEGGKWVPGSMQTVGLAEVFDYLAKGSFRPLS